MSIVRSVSAALVLTISWAISLPASAQIFTFERSFPANALSALDVVTERGKITVRADSGPDVVVMGQVSVRRGWNTPTDAVQLAQSTARDPPVEVAGDVLQLRIPPDERRHRAVTIAYDVRIPSTMRVVTQSDSGETRVQGVVGGVSVRTQSAAIELDGVRESRVDTGSGAVSVRGAGPLRVRTSSGGIDLTRIRGNLRVRTESGQVRASMIDDGAVDVATGSSSITIDDVHGSVIASTRSGRVLVSGTPEQRWDIVTGSSAIELRFRRDAAFSIEATSGSGSIDADDLPIDGESQKGHVSGTVNGGGPMVILRSRSGSITLR